VPHQVGVTKRGRAIIMALPESAVGMSVAQQPNIDAYFERIGFSGSIAPTLETLSQLHQLHPAAIAYENLDPLMGVPVRLGLANLQQKLVFDRRGGYSFEQNGLFAAVLSDLDYGVKLHGARVLLGLPEGEEPSVGHMVLTVEAAGITYLCDVGFGGMTPTAPLRLRNGVEQQTPLEPYRLTETDGVWLLEMQRGEAWVALYDFTLEELPEAQITVLSDVADSSPLFNGRLLAARVERNRRLALNDLTLDIRAPGAPDERRVLTSVAELREVLSGLMEIELPSSDRLDPALERILAKGAG